jgi:hypothetical protein
MLHSEATFPCSNLVTAIILTLSQLAHWTLIGFCLTCYDTDHDDNALGETQLCGAHALTRLRPSFLPICSDSTIELRSIALASIVGRHPFGESQQSSLPWSSHGLSLGSSHPLSGVQST